MKNRHSNLKWGSNEFQWSCESKVTWTGQIKVDFGLNNCTFLPVFGVAGRRKGWAVIELKRETLLSSWAKAEKRKAGGNSWAHVKKKMQRRGLKTQPEELPVGWEREGEKLIRADEELEDQITWRPWESLPRLAKKCAHSFTKKNAMNQCKEGCVAFKNTSHSLVVWEVEIYKQWNRYYAHKVPYTRLL